MTSAITPAMATPTAGPSGGRHERRDRGAGSGPANPSAAAASRRAANAGDIRGALARTSSAISVSSRSSRSPASVASSASRSAPMAGSIFWLRRMARLPELLDDTVQPGAGVAGRDPDHVGDLRVGQPGDELQRDKLALARLEPGERGPHGGALERVVVADRRGHVDRVADQRDAALA